jgi:hypothetical protein
MKPVDGPALTLVNCQAGCEYDDIYAAANGVEPGMIPEKNPISNKKMPSPKFKKVKVPKPSDGKSPTPKAGKKSPIMFKTIDDVTGEEISGLSAVAEWWQEYTGIPFDEWKSWGVIDDDDKVCFTWPGIEVIKTRPRGGSTNDMRWDPPKSSTSPPFWPHVKPDLPDQIWLGEGESSTGVLLHLGFEAYSVTKGAKTPIPQRAWDRLYERGARDIVICFDTDQAGMNRAYELKAEIEFSSTPLKAHIVDLTSEFDPFIGGNDLRDLWLNVKDKNRMVSILEKLAQRMSDETERVQLLWSDGLAEMEVDDMVFIVDGLLPIGTTLFAAYPKTGKSLFSMDLSRCVAGGTDFLGRKTTQSKVLYLALEDWPARLKERREKQGWAKGLPVAFITLSEFTSKIGYLNRGGSHRLAELVEKEDFGLVVVDTFSKALDCDPNDNLQVQKAILPILEIAHKYSIAVILIDHHRKGGRAFKDPNAVLDVLGAISKTANADTIWGMWHPKDMVHRIMHVIGRDTGEEFSLDVIMDSSTLCWSEGASININMVSPRKREVIEALVSIGRGRLVDVCKEVEKVRDDDVEVNVGNVHGILTELQLKGTVQLEVHGVEKWYSLKE